VQYPDIRPILRKPALTPGEGSKKTTCPRKPGRMVSLVTLEIRVCIEEQNTENRRQTPDADSKLMRPV